MDSNILVLVGCTLNDAGDTILDFEDIYAMQSNKYLDFYMTLVLILSGNQDKNQHILK